jgi:ABC-type transport system involved in multi-copper enzyme maturation permease subunit
MLGAPRRRHFYLKRSALVATSGLVMLFGLWMARETRATTMGLQIFSTLSMVALLVITLVAGTNAAALIARERQERTLGLLFLSDISAGRFLLGKLLASMFSTLMALLSVVPMFILAVSLGGVMTAQILASFAILSATAFFAASLGLLAATLTSNERNANSLLLLLALAFFYFLPLAVGLAFQFRDDPVFPDFLMGLVSPFVAMGFLIGGRDTGLLLWTPGLFAALSVPLLLLTAVLLRGRALRDESAGLGERLRLRIRRANLGRLWFALPPIEGNPVAWKDYHYWYGGAKGTWLKFALSIAAVCAFLWIGYALSQRHGASPNRGEAVRIAIMAMSLTCLAVAALAGISHCAAAFSKERDTRTMDALLVTDMPDADIVWGKIRAVFLSVLPALIGLAVCGIWLMVMYGHESGFRDVFPSVCVEVCAMGFGYGALALWLSLRCRANVAFAVCMLLALLWNTLGRLMMVGLISRQTSAALEATVVVDAAVHILMGAVCLSALYSSFREDAIGQGRTEPHNGSPAP